MPLEAEKTLPVPGEPKIKGILNSSNKNIDFEQSFIRKTRKNLKKQSVVKFSPALSNYKIKGNGINPGQAGGFSPREPLFLKGSFARSNSRSCGLGRSDGSGGPTKMDHFCFGSPNLNLLCDGPLLRVCGRDGVISPCQVDKEPWPQDMFTGNIN